MEPSIDINNFVIFRTLLHFVVECMSQIIVDALTTMLAQRFALGALD